MESLQIVLFFLFPILCFSHISWLFPTARWPHFDYTNTRDNVQPCGLPKSTEYYTLLTNNAYIFNWRMQYGHQGGLQINLLNGNGTLIKRLMPDQDSTDSFFDTQMTQQQQVTLSFNEPCEHCVLQLMKQAFELGSNFSYFTCADVRIIKGEDTSNKNDRRQCMSNGKWSGNECECDQRHEGDYCSDNVECQTNMDCDDGGVCKEQWNNEYKKICYCSYGKFGRNCELSSKIDVNEKCFNQNFGENSAKFDAYGIFQKECYRKKALNEDDIIYSRVMNNDEMEIILDFKTLSYVGIGWRPLNATNTCRDFPKLKDMNNGGFNEKAYNSKLHAMYCTDIVWASVINQTKLQIMDAYARDKSTPLSDENFPDGKNSLTAAFGLETNDRTIVMFRRAIKTEDPADNPLGPGRIFGIYAKGQKHNEKRWVVKNALESPENNDRVFIRQDEFVYHGADYRAMAMFRFVD